MRIFFKYTLFYSTHIPSEGNQSDNRQCCYFFFFKKKKKKKRKKATEQKLWFSKLTKSTR